MATAVDVRAEVAAQLAVEAASAAAAGLSAAVALLLTTTAHDCPHGEARAVAATARALCWDALHAGDWRLAPRAGRHLYVVAACLEAALAVHAASASGLGGAPLAEALREALRALDVAVMLGPPEATQRHDALPQRLLAQYQAQLAALEGADGREPLPVLLPELLAAPIAAAEAGLTGTPIPRVALPSLSEFTRLAFGPGGGRPFIITGALQHWPAFAGGAAPPDVGGAPAAAAACAGPAARDRRWANLGYLRSVAGPRTVPIEVGAHYMAAGWGQTLLPLAEFIDAHVAPSARDFLRRHTAAAGADAGGSGISPAPVADLAQHTGAPSASAPAPAPANGYLAQHALLDQVPALRADIAVPDYCYAPLPQPQGSAAGGSDECEAEAEVRVHAWFGPAGTVSCAHWDAPHNLLAQVVGAKRLRLHPPGPVSDAALRPAPPPMGNTSTLPPAAFRARLPVPEADIAAAAARLAAWEAARAQAQGAGLLGEAEEGGVEPEPPEATWPARYPDYARAPAPWCWECVLRPGELLYVPPRWWHFVEAVTPSFSVSFWW